eukprot:TRINITY_DN6049_c0_g2_i4.p1 TRINITY_DN6049_c0_g2~~TRINITY_DN6049_c0_g2_i4.p1  ORF type:complete len:197 (+),score=-10.35 TRINITY_DN6049_c0_g2_i4:1187-1777(+)
MVGTLFNIYQIYQNVYCDTFYYRDKIQEIRMHFILKSYIIKSFLGKYLFFQSLLQQYSLNQKQQKYVRTFQPLIIYFIQRLLVFYRDNIFDAADEVGSAQKLTFAYVAYQTFTCSFRLKIPIYLVFYMHALLKSCIAKILGTGRQNIFIRNCLVFFNQLCYLMIICVRVNWKNYKTLIHFGYAYRDICFEQDAWLS